MKTKGRLLLLFLLAMLVIPIVALADNDNADIDTDISDEEKEKFDEILVPVFKIYNFVKYIATVVAGVFLLYAGITYMSSGNDPRARDTAKSIATYVIVGLLVIWAAPIIINLLV